MSDDFDWGDDPFGGDLDFDTDFDRPGKKGFVRSFATGFLSGIVDKTVGSTDAQVETLKKVLPNTWLGAFSNISQLNDRRREVMEELKNDSAQTVKDLQYLAKRAGDKLNKLTPNKISDGLMSFSERDFSDWEKTSTNTADTSPQMGETNQDEINQLLANGDANSLLERQTVEKASEKTIAVMTEIGGRSIAGMHAVTTGVMKSNHLLQQMVDYQRRVQARNEAMKLNILARTYLTNAKFYKFMEASNHRMIAELKDIGKFSRMSDYEKTSTSQALKKNLREAFFNSTRAKVGGIADFLTEKFGKGARQEMTGAAGEIVGGLRMAAEMSEGMDLDFGNMLGSAAAGMFINRLPAMINSGRGKEYVAKFKKQFPKFSKWADDAYIRLGDLGSVATYATGNAEGLANTLARHYQGGYAGESAETYDDYLAMLEPDSKPLSKMEWTVLSTARKTANKGLNSVLDNTWKSDGTRYNLQQRTLADGYEQSLWTRRSDRTLNEVIPEWLSQIHLSMEKLRTGDESLKPMMYDYTKATFISHKQKLGETVKKTLGSNEFKSYAETANNLVDSIDEFKTLSPAAREELAYRLMRDADAKMGFSPYNYMQLENENVDSAVANEIRKLMATEFGVTDEVFSKFQSSDALDQTKMLAYLPTEKARKKVVGVSEATNSMASWMPDMTNQLDILKGSGYFDTLKQSGLIKTSESGYDEINMDLFWKNARGYIKDPNRISSKSTPDEVLRTLLGDVPTDGSSASGSGPVFNPNNRGGGGATLSLDGITQLNQTLGDIGNLNKTLSQLSTSIERMAPSTGNDFSGLNTGIGSLNEKVARLVELADFRNGLLDKILLAQPVKRNNNLTPDQEKELHKEKKSIIDRIRGFGFKDMFNKGVDKILDNEPLILGGLLGGLAGVAFHNPKAAALLGGGAAVALAYGKIKGLANARNATDTEDLYEEGSNTPILEAFKLKRGDYLDMTTGFIIDSWSKIKGSVKDITNGTIIGGRKLAGKLFTAENKEVFLKGLSKIREMMIKAFNFIDPMGRLNNIKNKLTARFYQMDVYKEGEDSPVLLGKSFAGGAYYKRSSSGEMVELKGWNEIDGPVYDREGNVLITQQDYDRGLRTSMGVSINKLSKATSSAGKYLGEMLSKVKAKAAPAFNTAKDKVGQVFSADYSPIVNSVDRIYALLLKHWGYQDSALPLFNTPEVKPDVTLSPEEIERREEQGIQANASKFSILAAAEAKLNPGKPRLNSLADKMLQEKAEKDNRAKDAVISIAESLTAPDPNDKSKKKKQGLFGMLMGGLGGLTSLIGKISGLMFGGIWSGIKLLGTFASMGLKAFPLMTSGIMGIAKVLGAVGGLGKGLLNAGGLLEDKVGPDGKKTKSRTKGFMRGGLKLGLGAAASMAASGLVSAGVIEEGGAVDKVLDYGGTAMSVVGGVQMAASATGIGLGGLGAGAAALLFNPITLGALAVGAAGYGIYRYINRGSGKQVELRMTQYGIADMESEIAGKIFQAEAELSNYVTVSAGRAAFSNNAPIQKVLAMLATDPSDQKHMGDIFTWFNGRFKPVMLTYMACIHAIGMKTFKEYDESVKRPVYQAASQTHQALSGITPRPYSIVAPISKDTAVLGEKSTIIRVNKLLEELKEYVDRKKDIDDTKAVAMPTAKRDLAKEKEALEKELATVEAEGGLFSGIKKNSVQNKLNAVNAEISKLNNAYKPGTIAGDTDIADLIGEGGTLDPLTAIRVAAYGNDQGIPWRIEAVLKLERYCEPLFTVSGTDVTFKGNAGEIFGHFMNAFRVDAKWGDNWCLWFADRFIPVLTQYMKLVNKYRKGKPASVWKSLTATARFEIAKGLIETMVMTKKGVVPVWNVRSSPFKLSTSGQQSEHINQMLMLMEEASAQARLKDPTGEIAKTGGDDIQVNTKKAIQGGIDSVNNTPQSPMAELANQTTMPETKAGYVPVNGVDDTSHIDTTKATPAPVVAKAEAKVEEPKASVAAQSKPKEQPIIGKTMGLAAVPVSVSRPVEPPKTPEPVVEKKPPVMNPEERKAFEAFIRKKHDAEIAKQEKAVAEANQRYQAEQKDLHYSIGPDGRYTSGDPTFDAKQRHRATMMGIDPEHLLRKGYEKQMTEGRDLKTNRPQVVDKSTPVQPVLDSSAVEKVAEAVTKKGDESNQVQLAILKELQKLNENSQPAQKTVALS